MAKCKHYFTQTKIMIFFNKNKNLLIGALMLLGLIYGACRTVRFKPVDTLIIGTWERTPLDTAGKREQWTFRPDGFLKITDQGVPRLFVDRFGARDTLMPYKISPSGSKWMLFTDNYFTPNDQNIHWIVVDLDSKNLYLSSIQNDRRRSMEQREFVRVN